MTHTIALLTSLIALVPPVQLRGPAELSLTTDSLRRGSVPAADSLRTLRASRRAQEQFESYRRANLPFLASSGGGDCNLRGGIMVGRLCYWPDEGEPAKEIPEPERIGRARERLLVLLADAARRLPGDEWITGQRVRYLIDARRQADAIAAARECASPSWWCSALIGLALHSAGDFARADSAFERALVSMPQEQRCEWTDISLFLDGPIEKTYRRLPCSERESIERRFWWLSQPLYSTAGNDARTEFLARRTMSRLEGQARSAFNMSWGSDLEELLMRFGWSTWWTQDYPSSVSLSASSRVTGHGPTPSFFFHPSDQLLAGAPVDARSQDWEPRTKRLVARYAPAYAASFSDLQTQVAVFRRGDSALVVAAYEPPRDSLFDGASTEAALAVGRDEAAPMVVVRASGDARDAAPLVAHTARGPLLVSVELRAPRTRGVARARFGIRPSGAGRLAVSDLLLYAVDGSAVTSLDGAVAHALRAPRTAAGGRVGAYWETYGLRPAGEPVSVTLSVERTSVPWHTRAAERLGLASKVTPLKVRWQEMPSRDAGFASRAITVDLSSLPAGRYRMLLTVSAEDGSTASTERELELRGPRSEVRGPVRGLGSRSKVLGRRSWVLGLGLIEERSRPSAATAAPSQVPRLGREHSPDFIGQG